jgi:4-oxalocrotonate tautomerase family enzyme
MPQIRIETKAGNSKEFLKKFMDVTMTGVQEVLQLPENDRNIRLMEFDPELFSTKPPYEFIIEIMLFEGRTKETKKRLFEKIVTELHSRLGIAKESVIIILNEQPMENWGIRGGKPADEVEIGFKVDI